MNIFIVRSTAQITPEIEDTVPPKMEESFTIHLGKCDYKNHLHILSMVYLMLFINALLCLMYQNIPLVVLFFHVHSTFFIRTHTSTLIK